MNAHRDADGSLALLEQVRCLDCGLAYAKPSGGGTVHKNPGCPRCGYLGWIPALADVSDLTDVASRRLRSVSDRRRHPASRSR